MVAACARTGGSRYDGAVRETGASAFAGAILLVLAVSACGGEAVSRAEYAIAACLAFDEIRREGGQPDLHDLPDPPAVYHNWHDAFVRMLEAWDSDVDGALASAIDAMVAAEAALDDDDRTVLTTPLEAHRCGKEAEESVAAGRAEYAAAACLALDDARSITAADIRSMSDFTDAELQRMDAAGRRDYLEALTELAFAVRTSAASSALNDLPNPPAVYRDVHNTLVRLLEVVADERDGDEDLLRATLAGQIASLADDDRAIFNAACGASP